MWVADNFGFQPNWGEFGATMLAGVGGVVATTLLGLGAICAALYYKIRVWVHPRLRAATHGDLRLVARLTAPQSGFNHAVFVVATAVVTPILVGGAVGLTALMIGKNCKECESVPVKIALAAYVIAPVALIPCYMWLSSRIIARSPQECWPEMTCPG
jgi:hypothetical protein